MRHSIPRNSCVFFFSGGGDGVDLTILIYDFGDILITLLVNNIFCHFF